MNKSNIGIDDLYTMLEVSEGGLKTAFVINGLKFWFNKQRGMVRLRGVAQAVFDAQQVDPRGVAAGEYDHLVEKLLAQVIYTPENGEPMALVGAGYDAFLEHIEGIDETKALQVHTDMPISLALVCLGKPVLAKILHESAQALAGSTSQNSGADSVPSLESTAGQATLATTSQPPAPGLTMGIPTTG